VATDEDGLSIPEALVDSLALVLLAHQSIYIDAGGHGRLDALPLRHLHFDQHLGPIGAREELTLDETHSESRQQEHRDDHARDLEPVVHGPGDESTQALIARC